MHKSTQGIAFYILVFFLITSKISLGLAEDLEAPASELDCTFDEGVSTSFEDGKYKTQPAKELSFKIKNIDLEGQTAQLVVKSQETPLIVRIIRAINANHFLEVVNEGFLNLTTIYDKDQSSGIYPAVHSRHFGLLGRPLFAHYTGECKDR